MRLALTGSPLAAPISVAAVFRPPWLEAVAAEPGVVDGDDRRGAGALRAAVTRAVTWPSCDRRCSALAAFAVMEPVTAATHRFVMHGIGIALHRSHHRRDHRGWEANDAFPLMFAAVVCAGLWIGFHDPGSPTWCRSAPGSPRTARRTRWSTTCTSTAGCGWFQPGGGRSGGALLDRLAAAHELHHRHGGAPYGMLVPIVPPRVRAGACGHPTPLSSSTTSNRSPIAT